MEVMSHPNDRTNVMAIPGGRHRPVACPELLLEQAPVEFVAIDWSQDVELPRGRTAIKENKRAPPAAPATF